MLRLILVLATGFLTTPAFAHLGHVGELAGHAHWIGLGAVVAAGTIAAVLGKLIENDNEAETGEEPELTEETA